MRAQRSTQIADANTAVDLIAGAIERIDPPDRARSGPSKALANPLHTLPIERKAAMLGSILTPVIAAAAADRPPGQHPLTVRGRPPLPRGTGLAGLETVSRGSTGIVTTVTVTLPVK